MNKIKKTIRTYRSFAKVGIQNAIQYRVNFFCFLIGEIMRCFIMFFLWKAVFDSSGSSTFMGFSMNDMVAYLFISFLTGYMTYSDGAYALGEEIVEGSVAMRMIKPCSFDLCFLFQELGSQVMKLATIFVPIVLGVEIYRAIVSGMICFNIINFLLYFLSMVLAYLISFYFNICYGFLAFYLQNLWGTMIVKDTLINFLSGGMIPLAFLPPLLGKVLNILPFASLSYTPVMIYMGKYSLIETLLRMLLQVFWIFAFYVLSKVIWNSAVKRLCANGG